MLLSARNWLYDRRRGLAKSAGVLGGLYFVGKYALERLEEVRDKVVQEKSARDNLRRRFQKNQLDSNYTILALLPTLGENILPQMDVDALTLELQKQSKSYKTRTLSPPPSQVNTSQISLQTDQPSLTTSVELPDAAGSSHDSAQSWVDQFTGQSEASGSSATPDSPTTESSGAHLSDSIVSGSASMASENDVERSGVIIGAGSESNDVPPISPHRSKAELWHEVKILTFTRTLTIIYTTTLLTLLTHVQLNLLGRYKYVQSVREQQREEKNRERLAFATSVSSLFWGLPDGGDASDEVGDPFGTLYGESIVAPATEKKYLTLSWWLLHRGWSRIADNVRAAIEDVLGPVSLKAKLDPQDLAQYLTLIRSRLEPSDSSTSTSTAFTIDFLSSLIPPTPEDLVLIPANTLEDTSFLQLLSDTETFFTAPSFGFSRVRTACLDKAFEALLSRRGGEEERVRLAGLLPGIARWGWEAVNALPNELVEVLGDVPELHAFSALMFSSYEDAML